MASLNIAICGGGIASICLAHALTIRHPNWEVKIFEGSPTMRDESAAIGLDSNAQEALKLISPSLRKALDEAGGTRMDPSLRVMMGTGPNSGQHIGDVHSEVPQIVVHRGSLLRALHKRIPDGFVEMGKKLINVESSDENGPVTLNFEDGTTYVADALIGCDGISSFTRKIVLGADHPAANPVYTNGYNHRVVIPLETAISVFGEDYCKIKTQHGWVGDGGFLLTDFVDEGRSMQVIAGWSNREAWTHSSPFVEWPKERLRDDLSDWGDIGRAMTKIFTDQPNLYAAAGRTHLDTPTYFKGPICIAGDAAQSFPPFQGAGAGQAIEDALILSTVLNSSSDRTDILKAFKVYDAIRRPRRADVARSSKWAGLLLTGRAPDIGLDVQRIAEQLTNWASNIYDYDLAVAQTEAVKQMV